MAQEVPGVYPTALDPNDHEVHLFEGAVWFQEALYFSDFKPVAGFPSRILRYAPEEALAIAVADSGSNGLALDRKGARLLAAMHQNHSISAIGLNPVGFTVIVQGYKDKRFNSPNDLTMRRDGNLYFTDPDFQSVKPRPQSTTNVYRMAPDGTVEVVDDTMENPNGISLSPDESTLYVAGNLEQGYVKRYAVAADGGVGPGEIFADHITVPDGMAVDCAGNIYVTEHTNKRIRIFAPTGEELGQIIGMDRNVTNAAFGGEKRTTLYITTLGKLYQIELPIPGLPY